MCPKMAEAGGHSCENRQKLMAKAMKINFTMINDRIANDPCGKYLTLNGIVPTIDLHCWF